MTEQRAFTKEEFYTLLEKCPDEESDFLINYTRQIGKLPWEFFEEFNLMGNWGIFIDDVPIYFACLYEEDDGVYRLWTLKNKVINNYFTFFKLCKRKIKEVSKIYSPIVTYNNVEYKDIIKWNMRMGFTPLKVENNLVLYKLGG